MPILIHYIIAFIIGFIVGFIARRFLKTNKDVERILTKLEEKVKKIKDA